MENHSAFMDLQMGPMIIGIIFMLIGMFVAFRLRSKFAQYSQTPISNRMSGREIAEKMLRDHNIFDVKVMSVEGELTDHYNPAHKTVNLSRAVYEGRNAAAAAVAAHECGHAVQHSVAYTPLKMRSALVPLQQVSGTILNIILMAAIFGGAFFYSAFPMNTVLYIVIGCYAFFTLFSLVTLPVEFDASRRALNWMTSTGITTQREHENAKDALKWAALTYVVAAIGSIATLLYYVSLLSRSDD
ncbi:MAG TPA: zinc metallopeptidase [Flavobacteriales bacterium]|nr:zinc metallopeptidase [Flavobacteriales bacterium]